MNQLSKNSSNEEIKKYFNAVLKLSQSDDQFPVNLDEVWPLVYGRKEEAVRSLTTSDQFIQGIDYQSLRRKAENQNGGRPSIDYYLTVSCMEYFIVRKIRAVFDVYRTVFHKSAEMGKIQQNNHTTSLTSKVRASLDWVDGVSKILNLNDASKLSLIEQVAEPLELPVPNYTPSKGILKSATDLLAENNCGISVHKFNKIMIEKGMLVDLYRKSSKGKKKFKSITGEGLKYGENQVNPNNPRETQPLYFEDKFMDLINILNKVQAA